MPFLQSSDLTRKTVDYIALFKKSLLINERLSIMKLFSIRQIDPIFVFGDSYASSLKSLGST